MGDAIGVSVGTAALGSGYAPVPAPLRPVLPAAGLSRGSAVAVEDRDLPLLLALAAGAAGDGLWAAVGLPQLGALAAAEAGLSLESGLWVDTPGDQWAHALSVVVESVPVVMLASPGSVPERTGRRLAAVLRRSGAVLLVAGPWEGAQVRLRVARSAWAGVGAGHGLLTGRRAEVRAWGRGAAGAGAAAVVWLPGPSGQVAEVVEAPGRRAVVPLTGVG